MYRRTPPGLLRDIASHAAERLLPDQVIADQPSNLSPPVDPPAWADVVREDEDPAAASAADAGVDDDGNCRWRPFTSAEGRFRVQLPGTPRIDKQTWVTEKGPLDLYIVFADERGTGTSYGVCYSDLDGPAVPEGEGGADEILAQAREAVRKRMGGRILEERPIALEGHPGLELMIHSPQRGTAVARVFCTGDRFFQVLAVGEDVSLFQPPVRSFLDSFRLVRE
jgi:hypothetical protein